ncbi:MAG: hypothetical protein ACTHJ0_04135, partial [Flavipsychrobacter sp.]
MLLYDKVKKTRNVWLTISLVNLCIVALLGLLLRSKILFSIPGIDFKNLLHAHSHFAFGGWITLCLLTLMTYEILPADFSLNKKYKIGLIALLAAAVGMLFSFPFEGYGFVSILFSTLFIFASYYYTWIFLNDLFTIKAHKATVILCFVALASLCLSSVGPFTLAYVMATHSVNTLLYRDAIYTYLHLQYNGFFTLAVFALLFNYLSKSLSEVALLQLSRFAVILSISVLPTLCLSYLWHFTNFFVKAFAIIGCITLLFTIAQFVIAMMSAKSAIQGLFPFTRKIGLLAMIAFVIKTMVQIGLIFPAIGNKVFGDRAMIIAYLHLVMLGFITLFLLAYLTEISVLAPTRRTVRFSIVTFTTAVVANEIILTFQGLSAMFMISSTMYPLLLWLAAIGLF